MTGAPAYNPLERTTFEAIAYNAIGRASEIETFPAYRLSHSTGNSGWSVGAVQWDFGQPGRGHKVAGLLDGYQARAERDQRFSDAERNSLSRRLQTRGQTGNELSADEQARLGAFLRTDAGRAFVNGLNDEQIGRKWTNVGEPLSRIPWLQRLAASDPGAATEIVAMTTKLYNQNERRGGQLIRHLQGAESTAEGTRAWIGAQGIDGLRESARQAIVSGRDKALAGARLFDALERSDGRLGVAWRRQVHERGDRALADGFNADPDVQLLDGMFRNVAAGRRILDHIDHGGAAAAVSIRGINAAARLEMARITQTSAGALRVTGPDGAEFEMTPRGWKRDSVPMDRQSSRRSDEHGDIEPGRVPGQAPDNPAGLPAVPPRLQPLYRQGRAAVLRLDESLGRTYDDASERMAVGLTRLAVEHGLTRVDHVVLSERNAYVGKGENVFVVQGDPHDAARRMAHMKTTDAVATPVETSLARIQSMAAASPHLHPDVPARHETLAPRMALS